MNNYESILTTTTTQPVPSDLLMQDTPMTLERVRCTLISLIKIKARQRDRYAALLSRALTTEAQTLVRSVLRIPMKSPGHSFAERHTDYYSGNLSKGTWTFAVPKGWNRCFVDRRRTAVFSPSRRSKALYFR